MNKLLMPLFFLSSVLTLFSCHNSSPLLPRESKEENKSEKPSSINDEVATVFFVGCSGVGKSTLCNSIFQETIFKSGFSFGIVTKEVQEHRHENIKYIDTPGLGNSSQKLTDQVVKGIEMALKEHKSCKIIFVGTLDGSRVSTNTLYAINEVCNAIKMDFEYGIIFNKVTPGEENMVSSNKEKFERTLSESLKKVPCGYTVIGEEVSLKDADNRYFSIESENRKKLIKFIDELPIVIDGEGSSKKSNELEIGYKGATRGVIEEIELREKDKESKILKTQVEKINEENFLSSAIKNFGARLAKFQFRNPVPANRTQDYTLTWEKIDLIEQGSGGTQGDSKIEAHPDEGTVKGGLTKIEAHPDEGTVKGDLTKIEAHPDEGTVKGDLTKIEAHPDEGTVKGDLTKIEAHPDEGTMETYLIRSEDYTSLDLDLNHYKINWGYVLDCPFRKELN